MINVLCWSTGSTTYSLRSHIKIHFYISLHIHDLLVQIQARLTPNYIWQVGRFLPFTTEEQRESSDGLSCRGSSAYVASSPGSLGRSEWVMYTCWHKAVYHRCETDTCKDDEHAKQNRAEWWAFQGILTILLWPVWCYCRDIIQVLSAVSISVSIKRRFISVFISITPRSQWMYAAPGWEGGCFLILGDISLKHVIWRY